MMTYRLTFIHLHLALSGFIQVTLPSSTFIYVRLLSAQFKYRQLSPSIFIYTPVQLYNQTTTTFSNWPMELLCHWIMKAAMQ